MPEASFLEKFPLYRKYLIPVSPVLNGISKPNINMHCPNCSAVRTFVMRNEYFSGRPYVNYASNGANCLLEYACVSCGDFIRSFSIRISDGLDYVQKTGQFPAWDITPNAELEQMLEGHADLVRRGLILESQGYGIGAFGYYRRVVEEIIDTLLDDIADLVSQEDHAKYEEALKKTKETRQTSEKIDLVKDMLPPILRPQGMNPLSLLHSTLSEGLHAQSDERCLELSAEARQIITFLSSQVSASKKSSRLFTDNMKSLLDKKGSKG